MSHDLKSLVVEALEINLEDVLGVTTTQDTVHDNVLAILIETTRQVFTDAQLDRLKASFKARRVEPRTGVSVTMILVYGSPFLPVG